MKNIIFIACCNVSKVIIDIMDFNLSGKFERIGWIDDNISLHGKIINNLPVLGGLKDMERIITKFRVTDAVICLPENHIEKRQIYYEKCKMLKLKLPNFIHPRAVVAKDVIMGDGIICCANSVVNSGTKIGSNNIIWTGSTIDHDCYLESHIYISPGVHIAGGVTIREKVMIGTGATVTPCVEIGANVKIGAASLVNKSIKDNVVAYGSPANIIRKNL